MFAIPKIKTKMRSYCLMGTVLILQDEKVLKTNGGGGCTATWLCLLLRPLTVVNMVPCTYVYSNTVMALLKGKATVKEKAKHIFIS